MCTEVRRTKKEKEKAERRESDRRGRLACESVVNLALF